MKVITPPLSLAYCTAAMKISGASGVSIGATAMKIENDVTEVGSSGIQISTKILNLFS